MAKLRYMVLLLAAAILLSGCSILPASELYCLPDRSDGDSNLSAVIREAMEGLEYWAPVAGKHRQSVQTAELNGDAEPEYLVYARDPENQSLRILIFSGDGRNYTLLDTVKCSGTVFDRVEYAQMDNAVGCEILVGRRADNQVSRSVTVYTLIIDQAEPFLSTNYTRFAATDLDSNGLSELFLLRSDEAGSGVAQLYFMDGRVMESSPEILLSVPVTQVRRMFVGKLLDGQAAVYVESNLPENGGTITDVVVGLEDGLKNITMSEQTHQSDLTLRQYPIDICDLDGDGIPELPTVLWEQSANDQYLIQWYSLNSLGVPEITSSTYHHYSGGWYLELDSAIAPWVTVNQKGGSYEFFLWNEDLSQFDKLMTLYILTGQRREEQAVSGNRFVLGRTDTTVYAANLEIASAQYGMSQQLLIEGFHLIPDDTITGVN